MTGSDGRGKIRNSRNFEFRILGNVAFSKLFCTTARMSAHAKMEHAEHAAHAGHEHGHDHDHSGSKKRFGSAKVFGITMALIGVLIAFCSAMVGSERTEFTQAMIRQTQAHADYTAASTKY